MTIAVGAKFDHYEILAPLGAGGMGEVWRARDTRLNREVALKFLPAEFAQDADRLRRFEQEAHATSALNHPNILTVHDIGSASPEMGGAPFIVAELLAGAELRAHLNDGALSPRQTLDYAQQITAGLAAAHAKGIVHRDLKPENLFVTTDGRVKILDFGLAKLKAPRRAPIDSEAPTQKQFTDPGTVLGTVGYMAPEQVRGQEADSRADIFAFGLILYEMLAGRRAFTGASTADVLSAILKEEPPELSAAHAQISPQLEQIVRRCLEKQPERRFHSAHDLGLALELLAAPAHSSGHQLTAAATVLPNQPAGLPALRARLGWLVAAALLLSTLAFALAYFRRAPAESRANYTYLPWPASVSGENGSPAFSPDGRRIAFTAATGGVLICWIAFEKSIVECNRKCCWHFGAVQRQVIDCISNTLRTSQ